MSRSELWPLVSAERSALADALDDAPDSAFDAASLCEGWRVRDVVGHLIGSCEASAAHMVGGIARRGLNPNRFFAADGRRIGERSIVELRRDLRATADARRGWPMTRPDQALTDIVIHAMDIGVALGWSRVAPADTLQAVGQQLTRNLFLRTPQRIRGLRLRATDVNWAAGDGPEVRGALASILLAMAGRPAGLQELAGEGLGTLRARMR